MPRGSSQPQNHPKPGSSIKVEPIRDLAANGGTCLVIEADKTIIIDKPETIKLADELGICVLGR